MNFITTSVLATLLGLLPITAATISSSTRLLQVGDYATDSNSLIKQSQLQLATGNLVGQQFTLGEIGEPSFLFNSITFQIKDTSGAIQPTKGLTLSIYDVPDISASNSEPLVSANFTDATFYATAENYVTFTLNNTERNSLGELKAGYLYTAILSTDNGVDDGLKFSIYTSGTENSYPRGSLFQGSLPSEDQREDHLDTVFQVNVTRLDNVSFLKKQVKERSKQRSKEVPPPEVKSSTSSIYYLIGLIILGAVGYLTVNYLVRKSKSKLVIR